MNAPLRLVPSSAAAEAQSSPPRRPTALLARDPARAARLLPVIDSIDQPQEAEAGSTILVVDLAAGEALPRHGGNRLVVLANGRELENDARVAALLPREASPAMLKAAMQAVAAGLTVRVPETNGTAFAPAADEIDPSHSHALLTPRELEILAVVGEELSNKQVARRLGISAHTVKFHLEAIFAKLAVGSRAEAVAKGLRQGLIEL